MFLWTMYGGGPQHQIGLSFFMTMLRFCCGKSACTDDFETPEGAESWRDLSDGERGRSDSLHSSTGII
jgi:hypothetical protein